MNTVSIKLGRITKVFNVERTISGISVINPENSGVYLSMYFSKHSGWCIDYRVREIAFFEDELKEKVIKLVKKNNL